MIMRVSATSSDEDQHCYRAIAMHELGHFLGMTHNPDPTSVMFHGPYTSCPAGYTVSDQRAFCYDYGCASEPAP